MRNRSETGADKIEAWDEEDEYLSLKDYAGRVLVVVESPVKRMGQYGEFATIRATDEATGETRDPVMRGGSWRSGAFHCTAVAHDPGSPGTKGDNIGFRVVIVSSAK